MKLLFFVPLIAASSSADVYDSKTLLSVTSDDAFVDVRDVPQRLETAKLASKPEVAAFLKTASIKTLKYSGLQVVFTSDDTVSSADLCSYLKNAASGLPGLECECSPNFATKQETTDDDLVVNDPQAWRQRAFERMNMKEVWRLSAPYARRTIGVAVIDTGLNFTDPEIAPYRGFFRKRSGGFIDKCARLIDHEDNGYGGWANLAEAMDMAVDIEVAIVSISLGDFMSRSNGERIFGKAFKAAADQGIIVVASAEASALSLPADNYGGYVDIAAYGSDVYTGSNVLSSGTSFSCSIVSGAAAILLSMGVKPKYVAGILTRNVDRFASPLKPLKKHAGALNPLKAVKMTIDYPILRSRR
ncbi:Suppressor of the cold-sensitive snRNP bioproteinsis mutant brr1-1 [Perkinsus olseni]|uniref:subtilisin n=1 Tax=Perkinsus olseni TaxID=32597 RepID=A0A7J6T3V9_PEROL|nr:Suppressor of the cold-sensitive snRNP bioproteinsis mutant brr1-1 [Perkinsus olseni]